MRLLPALLLAPFAASAEPVTIIDATGTALTFDTPPERILCLTASCIHDLAVLDVLPVGIGMDYNMRLARDPRVFGDRIDGVTEIAWTDSYDLEAIAALDPDLILAWQGADPAIAGIAPTYHYPAQPPADRTALARDLRELARSLGREARAEAFLTRAENRVAAYVARIAEAEAVSPQPLVIRVIEGDPVRFWVPPDCGAALQPLVTCAWTGDAWISPTSEFLLDLDPAVILVEDWGDTRAPLDRLPAEDPLWSALSAVQAGRVHLVSPNGSMAYAPLTVGLAVDELMPLLHPDLFPAPLTEAEVAAIRAEAP